MHPLRTDLFALKWLDIKCYERQHNSYGVDHCVVWASFRVGGPGGCVQAQSDPSVQLKDAERQLKQIKEQSRTCAASQDALSTDEDITFVDVLKDFDKCGFELPLRQGAIGPR
jgi:hypothetical protein